MDSDEARHRAAVLALRLLQLGKVHNRRPDKLDSDEWKPIIEELEKIEDQLKTQAQGRNHYKEAWLDESNDVSFNRSHGLDRW
jgi:hypothetical protein